MVKKLLTLIKSKTEYINILLNKFKEKREFLVKKAKNSLKKWKKIKKFPKLKLIKIFLAFLQKMDIYIWRTKNPPKNLIVNFISTTSIFLF